MKIPPRITLSNGTRILCVLALLLSPILAAFNHKDAYAFASIGNRKLTLEKGTTDGGSKPGGTVKHLFSFTLTDNGTLTHTLGSIRFQYCTTAAAVASGIGCISPTGIDTTSATISAQTGASGFTSITPSNLDDSSSGVKNVVTIGRTTSTALASNPTNVTYELSGVVNPSTVGTFFVRINTYNSTNGTGTALEGGTVAASTANQILVAGTMPESLVFCTGITISTTGGVPDCTTSSGTEADFDILFSPQDTAITTSQMAASTNAGQGYVITVNGVTLTNGSGNTILAMSNASPVHNTSQFGMNLVKNTTTKTHQTSGTCPDGTTTATLIAPCVLGLNAAPAGGFTASYNGRPVGNYAIADKFTFNDGDTIADSNFLAGANPIATDAQIYTIGYIVNVSGSQPAGLYTSTLTYICTASF
jgi:hypothetical protein